MSTRIILSIATISVIIFWFYELLSFIIPTLSIHLSDLLSLTLWQIVGVILFFFPLTFPFVILAFIGLFLAICGGID